VIELTPATLDPVLASLAGDPARRATLGAAARTAWLSGRGALDRTIRLLHNREPRTANREPRQSP
jgi:hypothetical protein